MSTLFQRSFSGGEISPSLYARTDIAKYATGLRSLRNFFVMRHGGAQNRPGFSFVGEVKDSTRGVRLIPFVFNNDQTYVLEFGHLYMRVHKFGAQVRESAKVITGITNANPGVVTSTAHGFTTGQEVYITGVAGDLGQYLNNRTFKIGATTANTFALQDMAAVNFSTAALAAYTSGGTASRVYEIATPYEEEDLPELKFVQSADVITLAHPLHAPRELRRTGDTNWTLTNLVTNPSISRPTNGQRTAGPGGSRTIRWRITALKTETYEESLPGYSTARTITGITQANPAVVTTSAAHGWQTGERVFITGVGGMTQVNDNDYLITVLSATTFSLQDTNGVNVNSTGFGAYTSGGTVQTPYIVGYSLADGTSTAVHILTWSAVTDAQEYNIYREDVPGSGVYGFIGVSTGTTFRDAGVNADDDETPPIERNPFEEVDNYPSTVTYYQQRLAFGATENEPEKIWLSRSGQFKNFSVSSPLQDDDAITFSMAGRQVNRVKHMIDIGALVVFTSGGEWTIQGGQGDILTPSSILPKQYSYNGSSDLPPIVIGNSALYVQARGSIVRDFSFDFEVEGYRGNDLTIFSAHLFDNNTLVDWTYQQIPHSILWAVRNDGVLLGLTYVREQSMIAWHRHDTLGAIENVCVVPEGSEDVLYLVCRRTINGRSVRYVERMATRLVNDVKDVTCLDSYLTYDGRNKNTAHTMTVTGSGWTYLDTLTLTSSTAFFTSQDVGNAIHITGADGALVKFQITAFTSSTQVSVRPNKTVPVGMRSVALNSWSRAVDEVLGLWHLEGQQVSIFADGFVVANPNNRSYDVVTVTNGRIALNERYTVIHVGLPYTSDIETLNIDTASGETISDKRQLVSRVTLFVEESRGAWVGAKPPPSEATDFLGGLTEVKVRTTEGYDDPIRLQTGTIDVNIKSEWNSNGRIFIRNTDPIPLAVLAIAPAGLFPFRG